VLRAGESRYYQAPDKADLAREDKVLALLAERFAEWQKQGFIPSKKIEPGYNTDQPIRERGWTHWHHLFNPRQLLQLGMRSKSMAKSTLRKDMVSVAVLTIDGPTAWIIIRELTRWTVEQCRRMKRELILSPIQALNTLVELRLLDHY
jgi:putative DNA methylase